MRDNRLSELNFRELLLYGGQPAVLNRYPDPLPCSGYCIDCERKGLIDRTGGRLDLMSHGCDSADFEAVLGPMPRDGAGVKHRVIFLLENPGGDYKNGKEIPFSGYRKSPPVYHYYWTPDTERWPSDISEFNGNFYGPYFAYVMMRHQLLDVYITNLVKCKWILGRMPPRILENCARLYLEREIRFFDPRLVLCFGGAAQRGFRSTGFPSPTVRLLHPSYIRFRYQASGRTQRQLVEENDKRVQNALAQLA